LAEERWYTALTKPITEIGLALVRKNLTHPFNFNLLFDFFMILVILILILGSSYSKIKGVPFGTCIIVALGFIFLCFLWICYCHEKSKR